MKLVYSILIVAIAGISPLQGAVSKSTEKDLEGIVNRTFLQNKEMNELFYMIASKKIAESGKSIDPEEFANALKSELKNPENMKKFEKIYLSRFNEKEIGEIQSIVSNPVYEKYTLAEPEIIRESVKELDNIIDGLISKEAGNKVPVAVSILEVTEANFEKEVTLSKQPVVLDFYAEWCAPCKGMQAILQSLSKEYEGKVKFTKLDIDKAKAIAEKFHVKDLPVVIFIKDGKIAEVQSGFADKKTLDEKIKKHLL